MRERVLCRVGLFSFGVSQVPTPVNQNQRNVEMLLRKGGERYAMCVGVVKAGAEKKGKGTQAAAPPSCD
jgi:hypothetical protein